MFRTLGVVVARGQPYVQQNIHCVRTRRRSADHLQMVVRTRTCERDFAKRRQKVEQCSECTQAQQRRRGPGWIRARVQARATAPVDPSPSPSPSAAAAADTLGTDDMSRVLTAPVDGRYTLTDPLFVSAMITSPVADTTASPPGSDSAAAAPRPSLKPALPEPARVVTCGKGGGAKMSNEK